MKKLLILILSVVVLTSCSNKASRNEEIITKQLEEVNSEIERLNKELLSFENQLAEKTKKMVELEELVESLKNYDRESINQLSTLVAMNEK
ncbi:MAG: lipoprotein, partial [Planococcaceae bacterium]|nr:lipoprotein [Planococcaceae bacterium]